MRMRNSSLVNRFVGVLLDILVSGILVRGERREGKYKWSSGGEKS
jgi:hypothetical protein